MLSVPIRVAVANVNGKNELYMKRVLAYFEFINSLETRHADLAHFQYSMIEHPSKHEIIWSLLGGLAEYEQGGVVFLAPEIERG